MSVLSANAVSPEAAFVVLRRALAYYGRVKLRADLRGAGAMRPRGVMRDQRRRIVAVWVTLGPLHVHAVRKAYV
jgi:hypothetical protein